MSKFNKGDKVRNVATDEIGYIIEIYPPHRGRQRYKVKYDDREAEENSEVLAHDFIITDPFERVKGRYFDHYSEYLKGNTSFKIRSSNNSTISSLKASRTIFRTYQFIPLLKFLNSDNKRILIADEVGLGKTIEAGHIMLELKARGEFNNALVICPNSIRSNWATELNEKFGLDFFEVETKDTLIHELIHHNGTVRAVVNYDKVRGTSDILQLIEERNIKFSIIICDESHRLRNGNTLLYHGVKRLLPCSESVVFMSATPIMINEDNLYNQLHLLDSEMYDNLEIFRNNVFLNRPFVKALSQLNKGYDLLNIADELYNSEVITSNTINEVETTRKFLVKDYFKDYPIYQNITKLFSQKEDTQEIRAKLQYYLSEMSPMSTIFSRTRKREVTKDWSQAERNPFTHRVGLYEDERYAYEKTIDDYISEHDFGGRFSGNMGLTTVERQLASSVWAYLNNHEDLDRGIDVYNDKKDAKFEKLLSILNTVVGHGNNKIIVFAIFKKTIKYLSLRLKNAGVKSVMLYGDSSINKIEVLNSFRTDDSIEVLLTSEVGSEGLDMQFCNTLINYDLPWNPMVVEQRIGRIDRFGQKSPKVNINTIIVNESILENIYERLLVRIGIFRESIGDLEAILDSEMETSEGKKISIKEAINDLGRDFYSDKLSQEEKQRKEWEIAKAIEYEKINLKKIEEGLTNTLTNDSYFREEINKIVNNNAYVTSHELYQFIQQIIKEYLTTCELIPSKTSNVYIFKIPKSDPKILKRFLEKYRPNAIEDVKVFNRYIFEIEDHLELNITFDQEIAFNEKGLSYINIYHPIIRAGVQMFEEKRDKSRCTFFFQLDSKHLPDDFKKGLYILAIYKISVSRTLFEKSRVTESLYPLLYDIGRSCIVKDHNLAEKFMGCAQVDGKYAPFDDSIKLEEDLLAGLRYDFSDYINDYVLECQSDFQNRLDNNKIMREQQTKQYYDIRQKRLEESISAHEMRREEAEFLNNEALLKTCETNLRLLRSNLRDLIARRDDDMKRINKDVNLKVLPEIKSLNLVQVI